MATVKLSQAVGAGGFLPTIETVDLGTALPADIARSNRLLSGFSQNGDYFELPPLTNGSLEYYNNAKVQQWAYTAGSFFSGHDLIGGICLRGSTLYVVTVEQASTPHAIGLSTVNAAGTITNIGVAPQPSNEPSNDPSLGGSHLYVKSNGNLGLVYSTLGELEINISTGAVGSWDLTQNSGLPVNEGACYFSGIAVSQIGYGSAVISNSDGSPAVGVNTPPQIGIPYVQMGYIYDWNSGNYEVAGAANNPPGFLYNPKAYTKQALEDWCSAVANQYGVTLT